MTFGDLFRLMQWAVIIALGIAALFAIVMVIVWLSVMSLSRFGKGYERTEIVPHPKTGKPWAVPFRLKFYSKLSKWVSKLTRHPSAQTTGWRDIITALVSDGDIAGVTLAHEVGGHGWQWLKYTSLAMCAYLTRGMLFHGYFNSWAEVAARAYAELYRELWPTYVLKGGELLRWYDHPAERDIWQRANGITGPIPTRENPQRIPFAA